MHERQKLYSTQNFNKALHQKQVKYQTLGWGNSAGYETLEVFISGRASTLGQRTTVEHFEKLRRSRSRDNEI